jgi:4-amino-4-deoxy-L-arabinose transferase-like glycosyltransferase
LTPDRRTLLALFSIAFGLRVLYAALVGTDPAINPSPGTYDYYLAERLHDNTEWLSEPFTPRAPVYPLLLAAAFRVLGVRQWVAILLNAFIGAMTVLIVYRIGDKWLGRGVGLIAALWLSLSVHQMHFASIFVRDTLVTFALAWLCLAISRNFRRMRQAVWVGIVYACLIHVDPQFLVLLPFLLLFFAFFATHHRLLNVQYVFLLLVTVFVVVLPWTIRNAVVYGEIIPVALEAKPYIRPVTGLVSPGEGELPGADEIEAAGLMRAHPEGVVQNTIEFWRITRLRDTEGDPSRHLRPEPAWSLRHNLINIANFGVLLPFAVVGLVIALRRRNRAATALTLVTLVYYGTRAILGATERSRLSIEPLVILLGVYGFFELVKMLRSTRREVEPPVSAEAAG